MKINDITTSNIRDFVSGNWNYFTGNIPRHYLEQFVYRAFICKPCLEDGKCKHCGCTTPNLFFAPRKMDKLDKWPPFFFKEEDWEQYQKDHLHAMEFTTLFREKMGVAYDHLDRASMLTLVEDISTLLAEHRDRDAENPDIPLEDTEFYKGLLDRQSDLSSQHTESPTGDSLGRTVFVSGVL